MSYTTTQLADAVLRSLAVVDATETPETDHRTYVTDTYTQLWEELASHGTELIYWPYAEIPAPVFLILKDMLVLEVGPAFGRTIAPAEKDAQRSMIEKRLRKHTQVQASKLPTQAVYF
tara:strand:+ start:1385 stop:1738 length:354 start_codon:yes stop_codon:yes gene_type:complete